RPVATPPPVERTAKTTGELPRRVPDTQALLSRPLTPAVVVETATRALPVVALHAQTLPQSPGERGGDLPRSVSVSPGVVSAPPQWGQRPAAPPLPAAEAPVSDQIGAEIVARAQVKADDQHTQFTLELRPPELGSVRVQLSTSREGVQAHLVVADAAVRQLVEG